MSVLFVEKLAIKFFILNVCYLCVYMVVGMEDDFNGENKACFPGGSSFQRL